jgi:hypothetical protein
MNQTLYNIAAYALPLVTSGVGFCCGGIGYHRTRLRPFAFWIASGALGLVGSILQFKVQFPTSPLSKEMYHGLWFIWCLVLIVSCLLGAIGTILLVRHIISKSHERTVA